MGERGSHDKYFPPHRKTAVEKEGEGWGMSVGEESLVASSLASQRTESKVSTLKEARVVSPIESPPPPLPSARSPRREKFSRCQVKLAFFSLVQWGNFITRFSNNNSCSHAFVSTIRDRVLLRQISYNLTYEANERTETMSCSSLNEITIKACNFYEAASSSWKRREG